MGEFLDRTTATLLDDKTLAVHRVEKWKEDDLDRQGGRSPALYQALKKIAQSYYQPEREIRENLVAQLRRHELKKVSAMHKSKVLRAAKQAERRALQKTLHRVKVMDPATAQARYEAQLVARQKERLQGVLAIEDIKLARGETTAEEAEKMKRSENADGPVIKQMINHRLW